MMKQTYCEIDAAGFALGVQTADVSEQPAPAPTHKRNTRPPAFYAMPPDYSGIALGSRFVEVDGAPMPAIHGPSVYAGHTPRQEPLNECKCSPQDLHDYGPCCESCKAYPTEWTAIPDPAVVGPIAAALATPAPTPSALETQVGGDHYRTMKVQPAEFIMGNGIPWAEGSVVQYVARWRDKGGVQDLRKARHLLDMLIEHETKGAKP